MSYQEQDKGYVTPCWIWNTSKNDQTYGSVFKDRKSIGAHRYYYEQYYGEIPEGHVVHHWCHIKACVNPAHLEAVTSSENTKLARNTGVPKNYTDGSSCNNNKTPSRKSDNPSPVPKRIATMRKERGMSQRELKRRTGLNIWRIEEGWHTPNIVTLEKIAKALDVPILELLK